jgi:hypothetical protein
VSADATPLKEVFTTYRTGTAEDVEAKLALLRQDYALDLTRSLALLALQDRRADVLGLCMKQGVVWNSYAFEDEANRVHSKTDPKTEEVLEKSGFRKLYPRRRTRRGRDERGE